MSEAAEIDPAVAAVLDACPHRQRDALLALRDLILRGVLGGIGRSR